MENGKVFVQNNLEQKDSYVLTFRVMDGDAVIDVDVVNIDMTDRYFYEAHFFYNAENGIECVSRFK